MSARFMTSSVHWTDSIRQNAIVSDSDSNQTPAFKTLRFRQLGDLVWSNLSALKLERIFGCLFETPLPQ